MPQLEATDIRSIEDHLIGGNPYQSIDALKQVFPRTNFGFNLGRQSGAADILVAEDRRYLIYPSFTEDDRSTEILVEHDIPHTERVAKIRLMGGEAVICRVPLAAQALDNRVYREQAPVADYLGAYEILGKVATTLARLYALTRHLPEAPVLNDFALTVGSERFIRLVAPYRLTETSDPINRIEVLFEDLKRQDPINNHTRQIAYFLEQFKKTLEKGGK